MLWGRQLTKLHLINPHSSVYGIGILSDAFVILLIQRWMHNGPMTLNKHEFYRTLRNVQAATTQGHSHTSTNLENISISHTFKHKHIHIHTHVHIQRYCKFPARNLFELSSLDSKGDRTGHPHPNQAGTVKEAMAVSLIQTHEDF